MIAKSCLIRCIKFYTIRQRKKSFGVVSPFILECVRVIWPKSMFYSGNEWALNLVKIDFDFQLLIR